MNLKEIILAAVITIGLCIAWWLLSPLFIDQSVDEAFPFDLPTATELAEMTDEEKATALQEVETALENSEALAELSQEEMETLEEQVVEIAAEMPDKEMDDEMPEAVTEEAATDASEASSEEAAEESSSTEWVIAAQGEFMDADSAHKGSGTAIIFEQGENRILRFENFESTNGPDLHVLLVENIEGTRNSELGNYIDLGKLKGNIGNQNYEISADVDLSLYNGVMIYCVPFHVVFSRAIF